MAAPNNDPMADSDWKVDGPDVMSYSTLSGTWAHAHANAARTAFMADPAHPQPPVAEWGNPDDTDATPRPSFTTLPSPSVSLPVPTLILDFRMSVTLNPIIVIGSAPSGFRRWVSFTGGSFSGSFGSGIVQPGGQDIQLITPSRSAKLSTTYLLQTNDSPPANIITRTTGWRTGTEEVLSMLDDPKLADSVDPRTYKFRIFVELETGDERYADRVNAGMWVGSGMRKGLEVIYEYSAYDLSQRELTSDSAYRVN